MYADEEGCKMRKSKVLDIITAQLENEGGLKDIIISESGCKVVLSGPQTEQGRRLVKILNALSLPARRPHKFKKRNKK